jgi:hypothetical protein
VNVVRNHHGTANLGIVTFPIWPMNPKQLFMLVEKKTLGHRPLWTSAATSVPGAPAPSGRTCSHDPVANPGLEMTAPDSPVRALVWTRQPPTPTVLVAAEAADGAIAHAADTTASRDARFNVVTAETRNSPPFQLQAAPRTANRMDF